MKTEHVSIPLECLRDLIEAAEYEIRLRETIAGREYPMNRKGQTNALQKDRTDHLREVVRICREDLL